MACDTNNEVSNAYCTVQQYSYPQEIPLEYNGEEKCDVTLPWKHYFWMTTKPTTTATSRRTAKNNVFISTNNNFAGASRYFEPISLPSLHHYDMKLPNFTSLLYEVGERNSQIVAFFFQT